jgi:hypothetical protein
MKVFSYMPSPIKNLEIADPAQDVEEKTTLACCAAPVSESFWWQKSEV